LAFFLQAENRRKRMSEEMNEDAIYAGLVYARDFRNSPAGEKYHKVVNDGFDLWPEGTRPTVIGTPRLKDEALDDIYPGQIRSVYYGIHMAYTMAASNTYEGFKGDDAFGRALSRFLEGE
jgi:hypothetical protein